MWSSGKDVAATTSAGWRADRPAEPGDDRPLVERPEVLGDGEPVTVGEALGAFEEAAQARPDGEPPDSDAGALLEADRHARQLRPVERLPGVAVRREYGDLIAELAHELLGEALDEPLGASDPGEVALRHVQDAQRSHGPSRR